MPFPREGEAARLYAHLNDPPPAPSLYAPSVPMALDDVVVRAMSKSPDDRYPSAGDLGRAAQSALAGTAVAIPERTVATGAAATREREAPTATPPTDSAKTRDIGRFSQTRVIGAVGVLVAAAVAVALIVSAGGGGGGGAADETNAATTTKEATKPKAEPQTLTAAELIRRGDEICEESREKFLRYRDPEAEATPDVAYSRVLVGISTNAVDQFEALVPPPGLESAYGRYVASQREVREWDRDALAAAEAEDPTAYVEARETRNNTEADRRRMAEEIGFHVCSGSEA